MLNKYFLRVAIAAAALTFSASASSAEQYRILILDEAFFPEISYVTAGDELIFVNESGETRNIAASDSSWAIADLVNGGEASIVVDGETEKVFTAAIVDGTIEGKMTFEAAPHVSN